MIFFLFSLKSLLVYVFSEKKIEKHIKTNIIMIIICNLFFIKFIYHATFQYEQYFSKLYHIFQTYLSLIFLFFALLYIKSMI